VEALRSESRGGTHSGGVSSESESGGRSPVESVADSSSDSTSGHQPSPYQSPAERVSPLAPLNVQRRGSGVVQASRRESSSDGDGGERGREGSPSSSSVVGDDKMGFGAANVLLDMSQLGVVSDDDDAADAEVRGVGVPQQHRSHTSSTTDRHVPQQTVSMGGAAGMQAAAAAGLLQSLPPGYVYAPVPATSLLPYGVSPLDALTNNTAAATPPVSAAASAAATHTHSRVKPASKPTAHVSTLAEELLRAETLASVAGWVPEALNSQDFFRQQLAAIQNTLRTDIAAVEYSRPAALGGSHQTKPKKRHKRGKKKHKTRSGGQYATVEDTLRYIKENRPKTLTYEEAYAAVVHEENLRAGL
jgi:hypothetical protein